VHVTDVCWVALIARTPQHGVSAFEHWALLGDWTRTCRWSQLTALSSCVDDQGPAVSGLDPPSLPFLDLLELP